MRLTIYVNCRCCCCCCRCRRCCWSVKNHCTLYYWQIFHESFRTLNISV